ncbi:hypothetical protein [Sicyoidochytrium minutum DNA virus]|nr:hypothetical protein [Sicyoidochytrium minutum DNA virus]
MVKISSKHQKFYPISKRF